MTTPTQDQMAAQFQFAQLAGQYYAVGRFAALTHCIPVAGNLIHHAVEMFIKCALIRTSSLGDLKALGHRLPILWSRFQAVHSQVRCSHLDSAVAEIERFERLRYPDSVVAEGMQVSMTIYRAHFARLPDGPQPPYHLVLEDVDEIASVAMRASGLSSSSFNPSHDDAVISYMNRENRHRFEAVT
jgi:hypothetical protein